MAHLLLSFAVKEESRAFQRLAVARTDLHVLLTGIGQRNAEKAIRKALSEQSPKLVITCGFAGGLSPELTAGTVVFSTDENLRSPTNPTPPQEGRRISDAGEKIPSPPSRHAIAPLRRDGGREGAGVGSPARRIVENSSLLSSALLTAGARPARFHCVESVVTTATEKRALHLQTGADAVEMESGVIRAICGQHNIPSATVRVISDDANQDLPLDFNRLMDSDHTLRYGKLTAALLKSPGKIGALLKLQKQTQAAAEKLAQVLEKVLADVPF